MGPFRIGGGCVRAIVAAVAGVALCGCGGSVTIGGGGITPHAAQGVVEHFIVSHDHVHARVVCPQKVKTRHYTCLAHFDVGAVPVAVTVTSDRTGIDFHVANRGLLPIGRLQRAIAASIRRQNPGLADRSVQVVVRCPATVVEQQGLSFTCAARLAGVARIVDVQQTDSAGNVHFALRPLR